MITFKEAGINGFPCSTCKSIYCIHCNRIPCLNCAKYQHPDTKVIHVGVHIICHSCLQEIINLIRNENNFYGVQPTLEEIFKRNNPPGQVSAAEGKMEEFPPDGYYYDEVSEFTKEQFDYIKNKNK